MKLYVWYNYYGNGSPATINLCNDCITTNKPALDDGDIQIAGEYDKNYGEGCYHCHKTKEQADLEQ